MVNVNMESCFFYNNGKKVRPICVECHQKKHGTKEEIKGWYWDGKQGYGPYLFKCDFCEKVIHDGRPTEENSDS